MGWAGTQAGPCSGTGCWCCNSLSWHWLWVVLLWNEERTTKTASVHTSQVQFLPSDSRCVSLNQWWDNLCLHRIAQDHHSWFSGGREINTKPPMRYNKKKRKEKHLRVSRKTVERRSVRMDDQSSRYDKTVTSLQSVCLGVSMQIDTRRNKIQEKKWN